MPQFYLPRPWETQNPISLTLEAVHHLRVRRMEIGESFPVFDGNGQVAIAKLLSLGNKSGQVQLSDIQANRQRESPYGITLAQGLASGDKMDWVIEKAVETGVQTIIPLQCERSVIKLTRTSDAERAEKRLSHWQAITQASCEQCERTVLPTIEPIQGLEHFVNTANLTGLKFLLSPHATLSLPATLAHTKPQNIALMIGPEGGFSPEEEVLAKNAGFVQVSLGERVLRTETAGIVAITAVHTLWNPDLQKLLNR